MNNNSTITKTVFFNASREVVWAYLTEKEKLDQWFHTTEANLKENEAYAFIRADENGNSIRQIWGTVLEMKPHSKLVYTFIISPFGDAETVVTWLLEDVAGGTRLTLTHQGIAEAADSAALKMLVALDQGWNKHLQDLHNVAEG